MNFDNPVMRDAVLNNEILLVQASKVYNVSIACYDAGDMEGYRLFMGVSNMLYMLHDGKYKLSVQEHEDNCGIY